MISGSSPILLLLTALLVSASPRRALSDYPLRASGADFEIGVEYTVHSFGETSEGAGGQMYLARDFLVFEIAVFPKHPAPIPDGAFELTVNNAKRPIPQVQAEMVAMNIRQPAWTTHKQVEVGAGLGDAGVTVGGPPRTERFPGDPSARRLPAPPRAPELDNAPPKQPVDPAKLAVETAFTAGLIVTARSGYIYFPYSGNVSHIKHLVLHFASGAQSFDITVK